jgi:predicted RNA methylase
MADQIAGLVAREEEGREPPYGKVLDLGCGSGIWAVKARGAGLAGERRRLRPEGPAQSAGARPGRRVELDFVEGDVTRLGDAGVGSD